MTREQAPPTVWTFSMGDLAGYTALTEHQRDQGESARGI